MRQQKALWNASQPQIVMLGIPQGSGCCCFFLVFFLLLFETLINLWRQPMRLTFSYSHADYTKSKIVYL